MKNNINIINDLLGQDSSSSQNKIPKIIHYVWLGKAEKPPVIQKCIESWRKFCPDFKIVEWNEDNFDIDSVPFVKEAIECKKWAFASDYIRLHALYTYGGVYLDTDMEILKDISPFLKYSAFLGYENRRIIGSAVIGCEKESALIKEFLKYYQNRHFVGKGGKPDQTANTYILTPLLKKRFKKEIENKTIAVFPPEVFYPLDNISFLLNTTQNSFGIHHFNSSWWDDSEKKIEKCKSQSAFSAKLAYSFLWANAVLPCAYAWQKYKWHAKKFKNKKKQTIESQLADVTESKENNDEK